MLSQYKSKHSQDAFIDVINGIKFNELMAECNRRAQKSRLGKLTELICRATPQILDGFHTQKDKTHFLRDAVFGDSWAKSPIREIGSSDWM